MSVRLALKEILILSFLQRVLSLPTEKREGGRKGRWGRVCRMEKKNKGNVTDLLFQGLSPKNILITIGKDWTK